jgi:hypothetical protein
VRRANRLQPIARTQLTDAQRRSLVKALGRHLHGVPSAAIIGEGDDTAPQGHGADPSTPIRRIFANPERRFSAGADYRLA